MTTRDHSTDRRRQIRLSVFIVFIVFAGGTLIEGTMPHLFLFVLALAAVCVAVVVIAERTLVRR